VGWGVGGGYVGVVGCVRGVGVWGCGVWGVWGCGPVLVTPYVRHSPDCTCCDFGHLRFILTPLRATQWSMFMTHSGGGEGVWGGGGYVGVVGCVGCVRGVGGVGVWGCGGCGGVGGVGVWGHSLRSTFPRLHLLRLWTPTIYTHSAPCFAISSSAYVRIKICFNYFRQQVTNVLAEIDSQRILNDLLNDEEISQATTKVDHLEKDLYDLSKSCQDLESRLDEDFQPLVFNVFLVLNAFHEIVLKVLAIIGKTKNSVLPVLISPMLKTGSVLIMAYHMDWFKIQDIGYYLFGYIFMLPNFVFYDYFILIVMIFTFIDHFTLVAYYSHLTLNDFKTDFVGYKNVFKSPQIRTLMSVITCIYYFWLVFKCFNPKLMRTTAMKKSKKKIKTK
jgi:hypothetical protein